MLLAHHAHYIINQAIKLGLLTGFKHRSEITEMRKRSRVQLALIVQYATFQSRYGKRIGMWVFQVIKKRVALGAHHFVNALGKFHMVFAQGIVLFYLFGRQLQLLNQILVSWPCGRKWPPGAEMSKPQHSN